MRSGSAPQAPDPERPSAKVAARELDPDRELCADLSAALAYWRDKKGTGLAPSRSAIDPLDIAHLLPRVMLVDVVSAGADAAAPEFRYRLAGTGVVKIHQMELTSRCPRDLRPAAYGALVHLHYAEAVARQAPLAHEFSLTVEAANGSYRRIILPLSDDGQTINRLMTVDSYDDGGHKLQDCLKEAAATL